MSIISSSVTPAVRDLSSKDLKKTAAGGKVVEASKVSVKSRPELSETGSDSTEDCDGAGSSAERTERYVPKHVKLYKTEMCRSFTRNGVCPFGDQCDFAHGIDELRTVRRHPKYKTRKCKLYHEQGVCPYGSRCAFVHNDEDLEDESPAVTPGSKSKTPEKSKLSPSAPVFMSPSSKTAPSLVKSFEDIRFAEIPSVSDAEFSGASKSPVRSIAESTDSSDSEFSLSLAGSSSRLDKFTNLSALMSDSRIPTKGSSSPFFRVDAAPFSPILPKIVKERESPSLPMAPGASIWNGMLFDKL